MTMCPVVRIFYEAGDSVDNSLIMLYEMYTYWTKRLRVVSLGFENWLVIQSINSYCNQLDIVMQAIENRFQLPRMEIELLDWSSSVDVLSDW